MEYNYKVKITTSKPLKKSIITAALDEALERMDISVVEGKKESPMKIETDFVGND